MDKGIVPEYSEFLNVDENKSNNTTVLNVTNSNGNKNLTQFGEVEISSSLQISTKHTQIPAKRIDKQIETRRADGKRRITPMFTPLNVEQQDNR